MLEVDAAILRTCGSQHGLVSLDQLRQLGLTSRQVRTRVERGWLEASNAKVFRLAGSITSWEQRLRSAVMSAGADALVARRSAAQLWDLGGVATSRVEVVVVRWHRRHLVDGHVIESTDLLPRDRASIDGLPVTSVPRTIIDCAGRMSPDTLRSVSDRAVRRRLTTYEDILDRFVRLARRGRPGVVRTRALLEERLGVDLTANDFERMVIAIVEEHRLPAPVCQHPVIIEGNKYFLDLAWPGARRFVECDGFETHGTEEALVGDLERQNDLVLAGWVPLRFAYRTVRDRPALVARQIRAALGDVTATSNPAESA